MGNISVKYTAASFSVYNSFIDNFIKEANPSYIKVYLYILRHANSGNKITLSRISKDTGLIKSDVISALEYWNQNGVLYYNGDPDNILIEILNADGAIDTKKDAYSAQNVPDEEPAKRVFRGNSSVASSYNATEVVKTVNADKNLSHLFSIIQQMLNKSLSPTDYKAIYSFIDYLKLPEQVVLILFEYCISINKTAMRYIETTAYSWCDNGLNTVEKAEAFIKKENEKNSVQSYYKRKFKITGRELTDTEITYLMSWVNDVKASEELIMSAYERTVMNTGKITFSYMDAIIRSEADSFGKNSAENKNAGNGSKFKNYPANYKISDTEKERIQKMLAEFEDGEQ